MDPSFWGHRLAPKPSVIVLNQKLDNKIAGFTNILCIFNPAPDEEKNWTCILVCICRRQIMLRSDIEICC